MRDLNELTSEEYDNLMIETYVPYADGLTRDEALALAKERAKEAAEQFLASVEA
ncbi:MAG: hypothetical protein VB108_01315 [Anaerolineaceae bacterium]|nr:hypothetical protein [Anaerolineaceae bacterium]